MASRHGGSWLQRLSAQLANLPAEQRVVCWRLGELEQRLGRRLPASVHLPPYWQRPEIRRHWEDAGFTAHYERQRQTVVFTRRDAVR